MSGILLNRYLESHIEFFSMILLITFIYIHIIFVIFLIETENALDFYNRTIIRNLN